MLCFIITWMHETNGGDDSHLYRKCRAKLETVLVNFIVIWTFLSYIAQAESGEDKTEIFVKNSFELSLPPHLIIPSSSIKLNEIIGQGRIFLAISLLLCVVILLHTCLRCVLGEFGVVYKLKGYIKRSDSHSIDEYLAIKTLKDYYAHKYSLYLFPSSIYWYFHINLVLGFYDHGVHTIIIEP